MIKHLLHLAACFLLSTGISAQTIPNNSFETWNAGPGYEDPDQWTTLNPFSTTGAPITVTKSLNAQDGSFAMQLESKATSTDTIAATAWLGGANGRGLPFTQRPGYFNVHAQYFPIGGDTAHIYVEFWKNNGTASTRVGDAMVRLLGNLASYTLSSTLISWYGTTAPDSVRIVVLASSLYEPMPGTILLVDNMTFSGAAGIHDHTNAVNISVYPNPAKDIVRFDSPEALSVIEIYDLSGRMVAAHEVNGQEAMINTSVLEAGIYIYSVKDTDNKVINRGKLNVVN